MSFMHLKCTIQEIHQSFWTGQPEPWNCHLLLWKKRVGSWGGKGSSSVSNMFNLHPCAKARNLGIIPDSPHSLTIHPKPYIWPMDKSDPIYFQNTFWRSPFLWQAKYSPDTPGPPLYFPLSFALRWESYDWFGPMEPLLGLTRVGYRTTVVLYRTWTQERKVRHLPQV